MVPCTDNNPTNIKPPVIGRAQPTIGAATIGDIIGKTMGTSQLGFTSPAVGSYYDPVLLSSAKSRMGFRKPHVKVATWQSQEARKFLGVRCTNDRAILDHERFTEKFA
jgi:hypothetical protein